MKRYVLCIGFSVCTCLSGLRSHSQADEAEQLALDIEKLAQFKQILSDLKKGYEILFGGYITIKNIAEGNFNLHKVFLDGLLEVSPAVRNYKRVAGIVSCQLQIVKEYKAALKNFNADGNFNADELLYIGSVYTNLVDGSLKNLDALAILMTAGKTRMSDDERISAIDGIYTDMEDKLSFLRWFNNSTTVLSVQRSKERNDVRTVKKLYGAQ